MIRFSQKSLIGRVEQEIIKDRLILPGDTIIVALSGGPDSVCLADILRRLQNRLQFSLLACHYNHKMRGVESDRDALFVQKICARWGIELIAGETQKGEVLKSEDSARRARYRFFEKLVEERRGVKIALAHNANDSAETLIFRLARGTGLKGLQGIPSVRGNFIRPLLPFSRSEIESYLETEELAFRTDRSNLDIRYSRNYIRSKILPLLQEINPRIVETLGSVAKMVEDDYNLISRLVTLSYNTILLEESGCRVVLDYQEWSHLHPSLQRLVLRKAIAKIDRLEDVTLKQLDEVVVVLKRGVGKKYKPLPHSLRIELRDGKIFLFKYNSSISGKV